jgi:hypothetical protein
LEVSITVSASLPSPLSASSHFLYATVGDDKNGMALTVLSALARQDVDPWQEAAELSRLPRETAMRRITSRLEAIPGNPSLIDRSAIAEQLLALLPRAPAAPDSPGNFLHQLHAAIKRTGSSELSLVLIYVILMSARGVDVRILHAAASIGTNRATNLGQVRSESGPMPEDTPA